MRTARVRVVVWPEFFEKPKLRRYQGYALVRTILLRRDPVAGTTDDLITHELCHIWQGQHRRLHMLWTYATTRYAENPYEREARRAVAQTRPAAAPEPTGTHTATPSGVAPTPSSPPGRPSCA